ncbi:response regulator transcription factor [Paenibacillus sp. GYB003]|uniref:response regulator transcription factor n=1 Tax=Paenibacillus sp. GYB003 TaxID=2994392 RepID=UPI002F963488
MRNSLRIILDSAPEIEVAGTAANGREALDVAIALRPDVVLMDIRMPVMDGLDATVAIKSRLPETKIVVLTTFHDMDYVVRALHAGAEGYILKAIDPLDLTAAIGLVHRGETMITQEVAKALFAGPFRSAKPKESEYGLTERELQVLAHLAEGMANRNIAERMHLSEGTVKNYISGLYAKLGVRNRALAVKKASEERLL